MPRDDFSKLTIEVLAKRVAYHCSNPTCKKPTIGPNSDPLKATIIGVAAHITAASPGGPRYDDSFDSIQRSSIENGIWLCNNCATLIDKDADLFPVEVLRKWKIAAENESLHQITHSGQPTDSLSSFLEADIVWSHGGRWNTGYSSKNPVEDYQGTPVMVIRNDQPPIIFWRLIWHYKITIYNNSELPAFNVVVSPQSEVFFTEISPLAKVNNLPPYQSVELEAEYYTVIEGTYVDADELLRPKIPKHLQGAQFVIQYFDRERKQHSTLVTMNQDHITNKKLF